MGAKGRVRLCFRGYRCVQPNAGGGLRRAGQDTWQVTNDAAGIEQLVYTLVEVKPALVVLEATGGYEFEAACALQAAGLAVAVVNPRAERDFARAMGALAKTDALDAGMLAAFARVLHQHLEHQRFVKPLADAELQQLQALVLRRRQLVQMITSERQRLRISHAAACPSIERVIAFLQRELDDSDAQVAAHAQRHHAELAAALGSVPGIEAASVAVLLAELPELGTLDRRRVAALVGVAPLQEDGAGGVHAQVADHAQCHRQTPLALEPSDVLRLTFKTVAQRFKEALAPSLGSIAFALAESLHVRVVDQIIWPQIQGTVCQ